MKCLERNLKQIAKWIDVDCRAEIWRKEEGGDLLEGVDWVIGVYEYFVYAFFRVLKRTRCYRQYLDKSRSTKILPRP